MSQHQCKMQWRSAWGGGEGERERDEVLEGEVVTSGKRGG